MKRTLFRSTSLVGFMTLLSRIVGFVRDMLIAQIFGAGAAYDAFLIAFKLPNFMRSLVAEGAFVQSFVPLLSEYQTRNKPDELRLFIDKVSGTLAFVLLVIVAVNILFAPYIIRLFAPGFEVGGERFLLATEMLRITSGYLFFISLTAFGGGILNTHNRFAVPAFTPVLLNISMIGAALYLTRWFDVPIIALAWGVFIGGVLQFVAQLPFLSQLKLVPRYKIAFNDPGVRRLLTLMLPLVFGASIVQINLLIDTIFASFLVAGSVSWLYYADRMVQFPLGIFGIALATVVLPHLSRQFAKQAENNFAGALEWALKCGMLISLPAAISLALLATPILTTLFQYGHFTPEDVQKTAGALIAFSMGLMMFILIKVLAAACYARQDMRGPVKIAIVGLCVNVVLNAILIQWLAHVGLALATTISALVNATLLYYRLYKHAGVRIQTPWRDFFSSLLLANGLLAVLLFVGNDIVGDWSLLSIKMRVVYLTSLVISGIVIYFATLWATGLRVRHLEAPTEGI